MFLYSINISHSVRRMTIVKRTDPVPFILFLYTKKKMIASYPTSTNPSKGNSYTDNNQVIEVDEGGKMVPLVKGRLFSDSRHSIVLQSDNGDDPPAAAQAARPSGLLCQAISKMDKAMRCCDMARECVDVPSN